MPLTQVNTVPQFTQFTQGDVNAPDAGPLYQAYLVLRTVLPPIGVQQIGPFAFDLKGDDVVDMANEVTDHWLEDNTAVQDHIGVRPTMITLKGSVSELSFSSEISGQIDFALASVENSLSQADAYLGSYTPGVTQTLLTAITQAQSIATQIEQAAARTAQIASFFFGADAVLNKQQQAFATLSSLRLARTVFTVFTPFQVFENMVIVDLNATQPSRTRTQSDFSVQMKQLQFVHDVSVGAFFTQNGGRAATGRQPQTSNGSTTGTIQTFAKSIQSIF